ncbi:D-ribose pyranase [Frondihabitans sp. 762G35]|uniref:D-ribose pyranase n=1 Tax=Frondihabitans sp. 762G35 TaxID=1446794 RepID=UPI000D2208C8|nr:D-ribose pyranase [Frondihabitans sp. 762G35]ARC58400.1 D-ribose pyranase [Frondihabitans sp. 762G35]
MRTTAGIIHPQLSRVLSEFGHTDGLVVADAGLPIPTGVERVDLAWRPGEPSFVGTLSAVLDEFVVERAVASAEMADESPEQLETLRTRLAESGVELELVPHTDFKALTHSARAVVRTGEYTPYSNVMLFSAAPF